MKNIKKFVRIVENYYQENSRDNLPWRKKINPYRIVVSEIMLQQTQVGRVANYFEKWMKQFPDFEKLAGASKKKVLGSWQGLGYNRRGIYLHDLAKAVVNNYDGVLPVEYEKLITLSGIGPYTAGAVMAFAYDQEAILIETNIRTATIYHFFRDKDVVSEKEIKNVLERCLEYIESPREWYWALMDYGAYLKNEVGNLNKKSSTYTKQTTFKGSRREIRSRIIKMLLERSMTQSQIEKEIGCTNHDVSEILESLCKERSIQKKRNKYFI